MSPGNDFYAEEKDQFASASMRPGLMSPGNLKLYRNNVILTRLQ